MLKRLLFSGLALAMLLAAPALAAVDHPAMPGAGLELTAPMAADCLAKEGPQSVAVEMLFVESSDPALCDPALLATTELCLEPVHFGAATGHGVLLNLRSLACAPGRIPPS